MQAKVLQCVDKYCHSPTHTCLGDYESLRSAISYQLSRGLFERLDTNFINGSMEPTPQITGAIFLALQPKQLKFLIADARISIVLSIQRHMTNEEYRTRLTREFHYRAFRAHLSESFRLMMVRPSNSDKYRFFETRKTNLAVAYQAEIERLETDALRRTSTGQPNLPISWKR
jgi:hypothetical protein